MATGTLQAWAEAVLKGIGAPLTSANLTFLETWVQRENIPQSIDQNNLLGTTLKQPGSWNPNPDSPAGRAGVQAYATSQSGIQATVSELLQSNFAPITAALRSGQPQVYASNAEAQKAFLTWSGGGYSWPVSHIGSGGGGLTDYLGEVGHYALHPLAGAEKTGGAVASATGLDTVGKFLGKLTDPGFLLQAAEVVGGAVLVLVGMTLLAKQIALGGTGLAPAPIQQAANAVG